MIGLRFVGALRTPVAFAVLLLVPLVTGCEKARAKDTQLSRAQTLAELRLVKRGVSVVPPGAAPRAPYSRERLVDGEEVRLEAGALAWLRRDGGATLLVEGPASLVVRAGDIEARSGKVFVDTQSSAATDLSTARGVLHLEEVRASIDVTANGAVSAYVLQGGIHTAHGNVGPGESWTATADGKFDKHPEVAWEDWTGGLATADPAAQPAPFGVGTVGARRPGAQGQPRFALAVQRLDVRVTIDGEFARTEVDQLFFNPTSDVVEGIYRFRVPPEAALERFGVDRNGNVVWGRVKEKQAAAAQYQAHVYEGSTEDPALLEWEAPGEYSARLYPIPAGSVRRVVTRYSQWLGRQGQRGERRLYVYPMAARGAASSLPRIEELTVDFDLTRAHATDVRVGMLGKQAGSHVIVKGFDVVPRADLALELFDSGTSGVTAYRARHTVDEATTPHDQLEKAMKDARGEADYLVVPVRPSRTKEPPGGLDLAIVIDSSAAIEPGSLAIARSLLSALLQHLGPMDRAAVWAGDATLRPVAEGSEHFTAMNDAARQRIAAGLAQIERGGASDIGTIVAEAGASLEAGRRSAIVYVGDGQPTVGELATPELRARLERLPTPARLFAIGVGDRANMALLSGIARGGMAERVTDGYGAAEAALRVLEHAERAVWVAPVVDLGPGVDRVFPRELGALAEDETALVVGRLSGPVPRELHLKGNGVALTQKLTVLPLSDGGDLRRRWAEGRLGQLLDEGAGRAAVVEVGVRYGVITPFTSLYVPTADEYVREHASEPIAQNPTKPWWRWPWFGGGFELSRSVVLMSKQEEVSERAVPAAAPALDKEGGTGTRAKGEEGSMGKFEARRAGPGEVRNLDSLRDDGSEREAAKDEKQQAARGFGMIGNAEPAAPPPAASAAPAPAQGSDPAMRIEDMPSAPPEVDLSAPAAKPQATSSSSARLHRLEAPTAAPLAQPAEGLAPGAAGGGLGGLGLSGTGEGGGVVGKKTASAAQAAPPENKMKTVVRGQFEFTIEQRPVLELAAIGHEPRPCPDSADLPFDERKALWSERLAAVAATPRAVHDVYTMALARCEARTFRERAFLLALLVERVQGVTNRVALWRLFFDSPGAADVVYRAILARVTTAADIRELHYALGIQQIDPAMLEKLLAGKKTPAEKASLLRSLFEKWPDDLDLALRLLDAYEDAGDDARGRSLARKLRERTDSTTLVRTAVGEYYLRLSRKGDAAGAERDRTEARRTFGEIVEFSPDDPGARRRLGDLLRAHGWYEEAYRQYETLARLTPDDASVSLLLAAAAEGMGRVEEAVGLTEKASGSEGGTSELSRAGRALASAYLAWARDEAVRGGRADEATALRLRARRLEGDDARGAGNVRVLLTWSHPELRPDLWSNALGAPMPVEDGHPLLGVAQVVLPAAKTDALVELHLERADAERAARLGATAELTAIVDEGETSEKIQRLVVSFEPPKSPVSREAPGLVRRFHVDGGAIREETP